ncbi:MAG: hypothetical protein ACRCXZ_05350 [Patescibacteria group bacterium]
MIMWLSQNEIKMLLVNAKKDDNKFDFRLFAPNNASILADVIKGEKNLKVSDYYALMSLCAFSNYKKHEKKENVSTTVTISQHFDELEKTLRKQATEFDKVNNKYIFDPAKIDYLGNSYDYYRSQFWRQFFDIERSILSNQISSLNNWVVDELWGMIDSMRKKSLVFENLKLNYFNPKKQYYVSESETKRIEKTGKLHFVKYRVAKDDLFKVTNIILDQVDDSLSQHITFQNDLVDRIKNLSNKKPKKTSIAQILGLSKSEFDDFDNKFRLADIEDQKNLEYLQGHLLVIEQNIKTLKRIKGILLHNYDTSILVGFDNLWYSIFTMSLMAKKDIDFTIYFLPRTKELVIVPEKEAVYILGSLLEDNIINTPELEAKINQFKDSADFFEFIKSGFQKIATIKSQDLEGVGIDLVGDIDLDSLDYSSRSNVGRVLIDHEDELETSLYPIHQFNQETFKYLNSMSFPILNKLSSHGKLINLGPKFSSLENYVSAYSENYLKEIYEREGDYFAAKNGVKFEKIYSSDDAVTELYPLPEKNWFINMPTPTPLAGRNEWAMPLPIFKSENKEIWLESFEDLASKSINPIYRIILGKNLKYENFESAKSVLLSDSSSKIPLGLSTTQFRSKNLTELRKEKRIEWSIFCIYADKIYEEVLQLFEKYEIVQIQFTPEESIKFQNWFFGKEENFNTRSNSVLYFYNKVSFDEVGHMNTDKVYNYLNPHKQSLKDIYIKDDINTLYSFADLTLDFGQEERFLDLIGLRCDLESNNTIYYQTNSPEKINNLKANYELLFEKKKEIKHLPIPIITQKDDLNQFLQNNEEELVRFVLFKENQISEESLKTMQTQDQIFAENLVRFFLHVSNSYEGQREDLILWLGSYTNEYGSKIQNLAQTWSLTSIYEEINSYIELMNSLIFPILRQLPTNDKGVNQNELINILNNFIYYTKPFLPIFCEKIFQVIYAEKHTNSVDQGNSLSTLRTASSSIKEKIQSILELKEDMFSLRKLHGVSLYQGMYADFSFLSNDQKYIKYLSVFLNLIPKSLMNVEGQIEVVRFMNKKIMIDLVIDNSLKVIAAQKEMSKIILSWKTRNNFKLKELVKLQVRTTNQIDNAIKSKLFMNTTWPEIFAETTWVEIEDKSIDISNEIEYKLLDIAEIKISNIS